jgi:uncharacterized protein (DUF885 family)
MKLTAEQKIIIQALKVILEKQEQKMLSEIRRIVRQEVRDILDGSSASFTAPKRPMKHDVDVHVDEDDYQEDIRPMRESTDIRKKFNELNKDITNSMGDTFFEDANGRTVDMSNLPLNEGTIQALQNIERDYSDFL